MTINIQIDSITDLIKCIVQAMVDNPDQVEISKIEGHHSCIFELRVAKEDLGRVIGKKGCYINAIRTLLNCASATIYKRTVLELVE